MKVCVLQPDLNGSTDLDEQIDPRRDLSPLLPGHEVEHVFLRKATTHGQLRTLRRRGFDIYVNLCEGYLDADVPSIDVIEALERLNLPYTGPTARLYDPGKVLQKLCALESGIATPDFVLVRDPGEAAQVGLPFPLFVKPAHAGDSHGIDQASLCTDATQLGAKVAQLHDRFDEILIERYRPGREFSVLVLGEAGAAGRGRALTPIEFVTSPDLAFKTQHMKANLYLPERNRPCREEPLAAELRRAAEAVFACFAAVGYCRLDFRLTDDGEPCFIDANFACSVLYPDGFSGTADYILAHDGLGQDGFLRHIIAEGLARHRARQPACDVIRSSVDGFGLRASRAIAGGEVIFRGEERSQRIVTRRHVERRWNAAAREQFYRYAYPLSPEIFLMWDEDPACWGPQNHSCDPNTGFDGLDVAALRPVAAGEELTLDYASLYDDRMGAFDCACGSARCRGRIAGQPGNSVDARERQLTEP